MRVPPHSNFPIYQRFLAGAAYWVPTSLVSSIVTHIAQKALCGQTLLTSMVTERTPLRVSLPDLYYIGFGAPIVEEVLIRGVVQDLLLTRLPKQILRRCAPDKESLVDHKVCVVARITFSAALFSAAHLLNLQTRPASIVQRQAVQTFCGGLALAALKESPAGIAGSIGMHMANNLASVGIILVLATLLCAESVEIY